MNTQPTQAAFLLTLTAIARAVTNTLRSVGMEHRADDIIADCQSHAWEHMGAYDGSGTLEGFLVMIAKRKALNLCRNNGRKDNLTNSTSAPVSDESDMADQSAETEALKGTSDVAASAVAALDRAGVESALCDKLAAMDPEKRQAARRLIAGERATDIAADMGKGKHWVSRVRTELTGPKAPKAPVKRKRLKLTPR